MHVHMPQTADQSRHTSRHLNTVNNGDARLQDGRVRHFTSSALRKSILGYIVMLRGINNPLTRNVAKP